MGVQYLLSPPSGGGEPVKLTIPAGSGSLEIAGLLEEKGLIRSKWAFGLYLKAKDQGSRFQAGDYEFSRGIGMDALIAKLNNGETVKAQMNRFTIPEGYTVKQIAERLKEQGVTDGDQLLALAKEGKGAESEWTKAIPDNPDLLYRLEGYLFPETYEMAKDSTPEDIVARLTAEWDKKLAQLPADWQAKMREQGLTFHEALTVASLVEREVVLDEERPLVAGVIYNRLKKGMRLQIDATVQYLLDKPKERLMEKDLLVKSPYNTYQSSGLPPGPIASPSLSALKAAIYPKASNYLYYVTAKDGTQRHLFAETYEQHQKNIAASKQQ
ncbi:aminodeoxychorismate lyase [Paenibacillus sp. J31TS4]|nr:aminodeoxychorismate lyase [Paenibacillus sp. J31TS4]